MGVRAIIRAVLNPWVILGALGFALFLLILTFLFLSWIRPGPVPGDMSQSVIHVISAPTDTPIMPTSTPVVLPTEAPVQGGSYIGGIVVVAGTGGDGLRLRFSPGLESNVRMLSSEGELFEIVDGPQEKDGYTWWYLENPQDRTQRGWAVADFLQPAPIP